jgi:hypothetical protein
MIVAVPRVLISAGRRRRVTKSPLTAPIAAPTARHAKTVIGKASLLPRAIPAPNQAQRKDRAERKVDPAHQHDERLGYRNQCQRSDLLAEKKQPRWK